MAAQATGTVAFVNVNVVPMDNERVIENQTVIVENGHITTIGPADEVTVPANAQVIEGNGAYLMPGLVDNHSHIEGDQNNLALYLANGVTTIRVFNATDGDFELKAKVANGELVGPAIYAGPHAIGLPPSLPPPFNVIVPLYQGLVPILLIAILFVLVWAGFRFSGNIEQFRQLKGTVIKPGLAATAVIAVLSAVLQPIPLGPLMKFAPENMVTKSADAQRFVERAHKVGADFIKTNLFLSRASFDSIVATANELGLPVKGHVSAEVGVEQYLMSGVEIQHNIEIFPYLSQETIHDMPARHEDDLLLVEENLPKLIALMKENNVAHPPTMVTMVRAIDQLTDLDATMQRPEYRYVPPEVMQTLSNPETNFVHQEATGFHREEYQQKMLAFQLEFTKALFDGGVTLLAGTDTSYETGVVAGSTLHEELALFVEAGLTPYQALETATRNSAQVMGDLGEWGTVEVGKRADLVLVQGNPLEDISNASNIEGVMVRGKWLPQVELQQMLDQILASYQ